MEAYEQNGTPFRVTTKWTSMLAEAVDSLANKYGYPDPNPYTIQSEKDWRCVAEVMELCSRFFPKEIRDYLEMNKQIKAHQKNQYGLMEDADTKKGGLANLRQTGTWPFEFEIIVRTIWPNQKFNKKFTREFFKRFPLLQTAERI